VHEGIGDRKPLKGSAMGFLVLWALFGLLAAYIASNRGGGGCGWFLVGVLLGPIGVVMALFEGKKCPACMTRIHKAATRCPSCQKDLGSSGAS